MFTLLTNNHHGLKVAKENKENKKGTLLGESENIIVERLRGANGCHYVSGTPSS
jgi:hypothetical protein